LGRQSYPVGVRQCPKASQQQLGSELATSVSFSA
jgi:hypothetical protein